MCVFVCVYVSACSRDAALESTSVLKIQARTIEHLRRKRACASWYSSASACVCVCVFACVCKATIARGVQLLAKQ